MRPTAPLLRTAAAAALAVLAAVALPAPAARAGGFATVGLAPLPDGPRAGERWEPQITVLQHGRRPLDGLKPRIRLTGPDGVRRDVTARPAGRPGVYTARVTFASPGRWRYAVLDGFNDAVATTYPPVTVAAAASGGGDGDGGGVPAWAWAVALAALALVATAGAGMHRRRRRAATAALMALATLALAACGDDGSTRRGAVPAVGASPDPGLRVWAAQGCGSCHTFAPAGATGTFGPDLRHTLRGAPARVIRTAITDPAATVAPGFAAGMMPEDYASRMTGPDLDRLVTFIHRGTR
jgi:hypothetical protein